MHGDLADPGRIANEIVGVFLDRPDSGPAARHALVTGLEHSQNWKDSNSIITKIVAHGPYDAGDLGRIEGALKNNDEVANSARADNLRRFLDGP